MSIAIREANAADVAGIIKVKQAVWPDAENDADLIGKIVADAGHVTQVSVVDGVIAGFVDGFMTRGTRWELDLIAVHPDFQCQGLAGTLMQANTDAGRERGAMQARGLVEVNNVGSQKTFARCGYVLEEMLCGLYVVGREQAETSAAKTDDENLIWVETLNYCGVWVEQAWTEDRFAAGMALCKQFNGDVVGAVIPLENGDAVRVVERLGCELVGEYQWWRR